MKFKCGIASDVMVILVYCHVLLHKASFVKTESINAFIRRLIHT
jgi:hypothetical protein